MARTRTKREKVPELVITSDGEDIFIVFDGMRIAKRGHPGTPQARTWVSLEPGYTVTGIDVIEVRYDGVLVH